MILDVLNQEIELIRINEPEREFKVSQQSGEKITDKFMRTFAKRNGLDKFVIRNNEASLESRRQFGAECDVCCKKFTTDKNMRDHRKKIHFSFLT